MHGDHADCDTGDAGKGEIAGPRKPRLTRVRRWLPLGFVAGAMIAGFSQGWHENLTLSALIQERQALLGFVGEHFFLSLASFSAIYAAAVALSFPGASLLTIAGGFLFGWIVGGFVTVFAATAGATVIYLVARSSIGDFLKKKAGPSLSRLAAGFQQNALSYLLFLRLTPVFPFWLVNIAPAVFDVPLRTYVLGTMVGIVPGTFAFAFIGSGLDSVVAAQEAANPGCAAAGTCTVEVSALVTPQLLAAFFALGLASLIPVVIKRLRRS